MNVRKIFIKNRVVSVKLHLCDPTNGYDHIFVFTINNVSSKYDHIVGEDHKGKMHITSDSRKISTMRDVHYRLIRTCGELVDTKAAKDDQKRRERCLGNW